MKAHIGANSESGLVHSVRGTAANVDDVVEANALLHGDETDAFGDAGSEGAHERADAQPSVGVVRRQRRPGQIGVSPPQKFRSPIATAKSPCGGDFWGA